LGAILRLGGGNIALTDIQARRAIAGDKDYKLADSEALYLFVTSKGFKSWRFKYRFGPRDDGRPGLKEKRLTFGPYPDVPLRQARDMRDAARRLLRDHKDPASEERKRKLAAHAAAGATFRRVADSWHTAQRARWSPLQATKVAQAFRRDVYPVIGDLPVVEIDAPTVLAMLRKVEARGAIETAKRRRSHHYRCNACSQTSRTVRSGNCRYVSALSEATRWRCIFPNTSFASGFARSGIVILNGCLLVAHVVCTDGRCGFVEALAGHSIAMQREPAFCGDVAGSPRTLHSTAISISPFQRETTRFSVNFFNFFGRA
jgi:hypothetical protein